MENYIKVTENVPELYSIAQLKKDNPEVSFPRSLSKEMLESYGVYEFTYQDMPEFDPATEKAVYGDFQEIDGKWFLVYNVEPLTSEEISRVAISKKEERRLAFTQHADPVFFKWQRGEATQEEWVAAVAAVKAFYPYDN